MLNFSSLETHAFDEKEESVFGCERQKIGLLRALSRKQGALVLMNSLQNLDAPTARFVDISPTSKVGDCHGDYAFR